MMLARQDFFVRYRRAAFGVLWAVGVPLVQTLVLVVVFSHVVRIGTPPHYPVFVLTGLLGWTFFSAAVQTGATSIVDGKDLSAKIYFPRAVLPLVKVVANLYPFVPSVAILLIISAATGAPLTPRLLLFIPATALMIALAASLALVLSALHVYSRDIRYLVMAGFVAWFYLTPVFYPLSLTHRLGPFLAVNPATGMVVLMRAATTGFDAYWVSSVLWSVGWTVGLTILGLALHRRYNRVLSDLL
jgi:ABC-type polysaccharide/polyol phosphate export permease